MTSASSFGRSVLDMMARSPTPAERALILPARRLPLLPSRKRR